MQSLPKSILIINIINRIIIYNILQDISVEDWDQTSIIDTLTLVVIPMHFYGSHYREEGVGAVTDDESERIITSGSSGSLVTVTPYESIVTHTVRAYRSECDVGKCVDLIPNPAEVAKIYAQAACFAQVKSPFL